MKKYILIFLIVILLSTGLYNKKNNKNIEENNSEVRAIFISYIELTKYIKNKEIDISKENINKMITNIKKLGFNTAILQIRSFSDAIYESKIFPWSSTVSSDEGIFPGYDILDYFIEVCNTNNISIYGWINPYRVRNYSDDSVSMDNPAYKWINTRNIIITLLLL